MPGSLTLCLGPLASGQTALTKILAGRAWVDKRMWHQAGHVTYNGKGLHEVEISRSAHLFLETSIVGVVSRLDCELRECNCF
jgi:Fe-S cluster assembly ATPase SufC